MYYIYSGDITQYCYNNNGRVNSDKYKFTISTYDYHMSSSYVFGRDARRQNIIYSIHKDHLIYTIQSSFKYEYLHRPKSNFVRYE